MGSMTEHKGAWAMVDAMTGRVNKKHRNDEVTTCIKHSLKQEVVVMEWRYHGHRIARLVHFANGRTEWYCNWCDHYTQSTKARLWTLCYYLNVQRPETYRSRMGSEQKLDGTRWRYVSDVLNDRRRNA